LIRNKKTFEQLIEIQQGLLQRAAGVIVGIFFEEKAQFIILKSTWLLSLGFFLFPQHPRKHLTNAHKLAIMLNRHKQPAILPDRLHL
jgi:hypothetical protein